ncbi:MAG: hypothetical protein HN337_09280 [Deltaproteobacteria bacterium]|jgi:hypothetical protein|nr:hypothetical protein [Deltaproteobacteria bacterium]
MKRFILISAVFALLTTSCGVKSVLRYPSYKWVRDNDRVPFSSTAIKGASTDFDNEVFNEMGRGVTLSHKVSDMSSLIMLGGRQEALDLNDFDEVADSTWFTNRIGRYALTAEQLKKGPGETAITKGPLEVLGLRLVAGLPRILVKDKDRRYFVIRFDPKGFPRIATGAEMISGRILHAAGYFVPANSLTMIDPKMFHLAEGAWKLAKYGERDPLSEKNLLSALESTASSKGKHYAIAVPLPQGRLIGPFSFSGKRGDDPNDRIPHQHRREIRALYVFSDYLDFANTNPFNTFDVFMPVSDDKGYIVHRLFDLSESLGSDRVISISQGKINPPGFSVGDAASALFTFGTYDPYEGEGEDYNKELGITSVENYEPGGWGSTVQNVAFAYMTRLDAFWAARILARFSDDDMRAIVSTAGYENKRLSDEMTRVLIERRDKSVKYWFSQMSPLDDFDLLCASNGCDISFKDLSVVEGFTDRESSHYKRSIVSFKGNYVLSDWVVFEDENFSISPEIIGKMFEDRVYRMKIQSRSSKQEWWYRSVDLFIKKKGEVFEILGVERK